jgi:hypothetical protein
MMRTDRIHLSPGWNHVYNTVVLESADERPALVADAVKEFDVLSFRAAPSAADQAVVVLRDVQQALVQGARAMPGTRTFMLLSGTRTRGIRAIGNDLSDAQAGIVRVGEVGSDVSIEKWNLSRTSN